MVINSYYNVVGRASFVEWRYTALNIISGIALFVFFYSISINSEKMKSIIEMLFALDKIAPGTASRYTLLYGIEVKFYSARVKLTNELETEGVKNLFTIGDGAGVTRGLIQASASGVYVAQTICARG